MTVSNGKNKRKQQNTNNVLKQHGEKMNDNELNLDTSKQLTIQRISLSRHKRMAWEMRRQVATENIGGIDGEEQLQLEPGEEYWFATMIFRDVVMRFINNLKAKRESILNGNQYREGFSFNLKDVIGKLEEIRREIKRLEETPDVSPEDFSDVYMRFSAVLALINNPTNRPDNWYIGQRGYNTPQLWGIWKISEENIFPEPKIPEEHKRRQLSEDEVRRLAEAVVRRNAPILEKFSDDLLGGKVILINKNKREW